MIGTAGSIAGGIIQSIAAGLANKEMADALEEQLRLQNRFRLQAFSGWQPWAQQLGVETARQQIGAGKQRRVEGYQQVRDVPLSPQASRATERDKAYYGMRGEARGKLGGYMDWRDVDQAIAAIRAQNDLNKIINFAGGEARNVFPYEMNKAQHSYDWLSNLGAMLSGGAQLYEGMGLARKLNQQPKTFYPLTQYGPSMWPEQ